MSDVRFSKTGHIAHVHLDRPGALNAITVAMDRALLSMWQEVNDDPDIFVVTLTSEGDRAFCAGADIKESERDASDIAVGGGITGIGGPLVEVRKPIVAGVQGLALGAGFELAMCADIIVASTDAEFGLPEVTAGLIGGCGVVHRAMRQLPYRVALGMILTGDRLSASSALQYGLANEVVDRSALGESVERSCARLLAASPLAIQALKEAATSALARPLPEALSGTFAGIEDSHGTADSIESRAALAERRTPVWKGC